MTSSNEKRQKSAPPRLSRDSFDFDSPHVEHVEVSPGLETTALEPGQSGVPSSKATGLSNIPSPPQALKNARAALQKLAKNPGTKHPESHQRPPTSSASSAVPASQQAYGDQTDPTNIDAAEEPPQMIPFDPRYMTLNISFGHSMPPPRWILERKFPHRPHTNMTEGVSPTFAALELEWVFDAGPLAPYVNSRGSWLSEYAYKILESTLDDPIQRSRIRMNIWERQDGDYKEIEDPIPPLPPPPATFNVLLQDRGPIPGNRGERLFRYPDYERSSLAHRCCMYIQKSHCLHIYGRLTHCSSRET